MHKSLILGAPMTYIFIKTCSNAKNLIIVDNIQIKMLYNIVIFFSNIRYMFELKKNLVSLNALNSNGCKYTIEDKFLKVMKRAQVVMKRRKYKIFY